MIKFWAAEEPSVPDDLIPLTVPKRLSDAETLRLLGGAFDVMVDVMFKGEWIRHVAVIAGYRHVLTEEQTPALLLESFVHDRDEHRLNLNSHHYPTNTRRVLNLTIPGGMTHEAFERFRVKRSCIGATYPWHGHIYGEWRTAERPNGGSPVFIELRQDFFQDEPLLLRVMFHQVVDSA